MASDAPSQTLGFVLNDVARLLRKRFEQKARGFGLTRAQWQALAYLSKNEGIQQSALAELLEVEPITLGRILDRLEAAELVERHPHPKDRRVWLLHTTPKAHPLLETMRLLGAETRAEALSGIPEDEQARLMTILARMRANLTSTAGALAAPVERRKSHG